MCISCVSGGGGTPQPNGEGVSAGRTGLGEAVEWNELHGHKKRGLRSKETDLCNFIRGFIKRRKRRRIKTVKKAFTPLQEASEGKTCPAQTGESGVSVFQFQGFGS